LIEYNIKRLTTKLKDNFDWYTIVLMPISLVDQGLASYKQESKREKGERDSGRLRKSVKWEKRRQRGVRAGYISQRKKIVGVFYHRRQIRQSSDNYIGALRSNW